MLMEFYMERFSWAEQSELYYLKHKVTEQVTMAWRSTPELHSKGEGGGGGVEVFVVFLLVYVVQTLGY